ELDGGGNAGGGASRRRLGVDARRQALLKSGIDAVLAECAFLRNAEPLLVFDRLLLSCVAAVIPALIVRDRARLIGAGDGAISAGDGDVVILDNEPVLALPGGAGRAHRHAGRIGAMLAAGHEEKALDARELAHLDVDDLPPLHAGQRVVRMLARDRTGLAS